ncbi:aminotransferase class V-fold PLP-dependent enzyme [Metabacillus indicus]|uniref:aminotransferase class V-fold PLP-dependent enzyme n=1 Tax=Metabacillus indicus TaxID=246786 RepID=UPI00248FB614|nr:aminotransferase class V-fold PLP-dependent enzyme [Metabacillus indicus]
MALKYADSVLVNRTMDEAIALQFKLVNQMTNVFTNNAFFETGDVGLNPGFSRPKTTAAVEKVLAGVFDAEDCSLVRGSGSGAIRIALSMVAGPGDSVIVHKAPMYMTTKETFRLMGLRQETVDYNKMEDVEQTLRAHHNIKVFYIQHARQQPEDSYDLRAIIALVKRTRPDILVVVDDNYCAMKMKGIGVEYGADLSTFSGFKLLGPEGIGVILGSKEIIEKIHKTNYSGGGQVQGPEAHELLRAMTMAPVMLAIQNQQVEKLCSLLNNGSYPFIKEAYITNSQSKNVIAVLTDPIASLVIEKASLFGAATYPVGAESKYEIMPMIYRVSGSFLESEPHLKEFGLRINPMKASAETVLRILELAVTEAVRG